MRQLSEAGERAINDLAQRYGFSSDAVLSMLESVVNGNGTMAQFSHPEFGGSGQWMRGGMIMVSDMFNNSLKGRIDGLCNELWGLVANEDDLIAGPVTLRRDVAEIRRQRTLHRTQFARTAWSFMVMA